MGSQSGSMVRGLALALQRYAADFAKMDISS
jgi:hypothetical protein